MNGEALLPDQQKWLAENGNEFDFWGGVGFLEFPPVGVYRAKCQDGRVVEIVIAAREAPDGEWQE